MISRCVEVGLPEPQFAVTDGFLTTVHRAALAGHAGGQAGHAGDQAGHAGGQADHAGAKRAMPGTKQAMPGTKHYCQPRTPPCCERAAGKPVLVKRCWQPRVIRVGRTISEDGLNGS